MDALLAPDGQSTLSPLPVVLRCPAALSRSHPAVLPAGVTGDGAGAQQPPVAPSACLERAGLGSASGLGMAQMDGRTVGWAVCPTYGVSGGPAGPEAAGAAVLRADLCPGAHCPARPPAQHRYGGRLLPRGRPRAQR